MKQFLGWLATAATLTFSLPGAANQSDPRLNDLFARLRAADNPIEARFIEQAIWRVWLESGNDTVDKYMALGLEAMAAQEFDEAVEAFDEIVRIAPDFAEGWNKRATVHYLRGDLAASLADIDRTLALEPRHFGALSGRGLVNLALGREEAALAAFDAALAVYPNLHGRDTHIRELREKLRGRGI
jgi:tetratricopeptide (TPR) repeat protein